MLNVSFDSGKCLKYVELLGTHPNIMTVGAPTLWNVHTSSVKSVENIAKFHRHLKTYLYNIAYPP